ncbi:MAG: hypothetical protein KF807_00130 [Xanthobacteraceae bacterium]|nr:hypothetical protein [Xanthobacteraceae bacterium]
MPSPHLDETTKDFVIQIAAVLKKLSATAAAAQTYIESGDMERGFDLEIELDDDFYILDRAISSLWLTGRIKRDGSLL